MVRDLDKLHAVLNKHYIGELEGWKPVADFRTPFSQELLQRVRDYAHARVDSSWWIGPRWDLL
eukprot:11477338-Prorocentrum_lima.AAC.1